MFVRSQTKPRTTARRLVGNVLLILVASLVLCSAGVLIWLRAHGDRVLSVQTGSMVPTFRPGDAVVIEKIIPESLKPGEIISYQSPLNPNMIITHRLIRVDPTTGWLITKGDHLNQPDPALPPRLVVGRVVAIAPEFGALLDALRRPLGLAFTIYLPALIVLIGEAKRLVAHYGHHHYRLAGYS